MNTLKEVLQAPLDKVERKWIRRPVIIFLTPVVVIVTLVFCSYKELKLWFKIW